MGPRTPNRVPPSKRPAKSPGTEVGTTPPKAPRAPRVPALSPNEERPAVQNAAYECSSAVMPRSRRRHKPQAILRGHRDHHGRVKHADDGAGSASNEPPCRLLNWNEGPPTPFPISR